MNIGGGGGILGGSSGGGASGSGSLQPLTVDLQAQLRTKLASLQGQAATQIQQATGVDLKNQRVAAGAEAAYSLSQSGYNPASDGDNKKMVDAISGGLCLIPGVGPVLGAYVEGMYYLGKAIYAPLQNAFASIGLGEPADAPPCATHGDPMTPERIVTIQKQGLPATPKGSFAELMVGALAMYASNEANCKGGIAPQDLVDAVVKLWNQGHKGPAKPYFIPPLSNGGTGLARAIIPNAPPDSHSTTPAAKAGKDPNVYYAFGPASSLSHYLGNPSLTDSSKWKAPPFPVNEPPVGGMFASNYTYTPPRLVQVNTGAAIPPAAPAPAPAPAAAPAAAPPKPFDLSGFASAKVVPAAKSKLSVIVGGTGLLSAAAALLAGQPVLAFVIATSSVAGAYELKKRGR